MNIISPKSYEEIMAASKMYLSNRINTTLVLPEYSSEDPNKIFPNPESSDYLSVTRLSPTSDTLSCIYPISGGTHPYKSYSYRSLFLTDNDKNVLAIINLDSLEEIRTITLNIRIKILLDPYSQGIYAGSIYKVAAVSETNEYHRDATISKNDIITNKSLAVQYNDNQPVDRNLQVAGANNYYNLFLGLERAYTITSIIPCMVGNIPTIEFNLTKVFSRYQMIVRLDTREEYDDVSDSTFIEHFTHAGSLPSGRRYGFIAQSIGNIWYDMLGINSNVDISQGVPFRGVGLDSDLVMVYQTPSTIIGATFELITSYLGHDCKDLNNVSRYLTPEYSIFKWSDRVLVVNIKLGRMLFLSATLLNIYYTEGDLFIRITGIYDENWQILQSINGIVSMNDIISNSITIYTLDNLPLKFFNQKYLLRRSGTVLSNII